MVSLCVISLPFTVGTGGLWLTGSMVLCLTLPQLISDDDVAEATVQ